jgi:hypothetical protein
MQDAGYKHPRISLLGTWVNKARDRSVVLLPEGALHQNSPQVPIFGSDRISEPKIGAALPKIHRGFIATG